MSAAAAPWTPLLEGADAARAAEAVTAVAEALGETPLPAGGGGTSVAGGEAGLALFFSYLDRARPGEGWGEIAGRRLERATDALAETFQTPGLYGGFMGVAWAAAHLAGGARAEADGDPFAEVDDAVLHLAGQSPWPHHFDLVAGLAGLGVYALERLPRTADGLGQIVERLAEVAAPRPAGLAWHTPLALLHRETQIWYPKGYDNLGLAHGTPGVVALLARAVAEAEGRTAARARELAAAAVPWLLAQRLPEGGPSAYAYAVGPEVPVRPARTAWCYGDPGVAAALLLAGRALAEPAWQAAALDLARAAARRTPDAGGVVDAGLCHGGAGLGHLFNRLGQAAGDPELLAAARSWFRWVLDQREHDPHGPDRIGGFRSWVPGTDDEMVWRTDPGFLTGAAGTGLALLAAASGVEPAWDRLLLLSPVPPDP